MTNPKRPEDLSEQELRRLLLDKRHNARQKRLERVFRAAHIPPGKTLTTLKQDLLPVKVRRQLPTLIEGGFVDRGDNLLAFGLREGNTVFRFELRKKQ